MADRASWIRIVVPAVVVMVAAGIRLWVAGYGAVWLLLTPLGVGLFALLWLTSPFRSK